MNVLITGGTGFIGSRLALNSVERGHQVTVLAQTNTDAETANLQLLKQAGVNLVMGSVTEKDKVSAAMAGCDVVFHLAAAQHEANAPDQHFYDVNVTGTENMLESALEQGVKRFVHGSTIGVYGAAMDGELNEESGLQPDNIYGKTKLEGEKRVLAYADRLPVTIVRISETYGPGDRRLLKLFKAINKRAFFMIGSGQNIHQLIYVDDLIDGFYRVAEHDKAKGEIFTLAGQELLTTQQMAKAIADVLGTSLHRWRAPLWIFMLAAVILETIMKPMGLQPPLHRRRMDFFRKSFYFSQKKAEELLQFKTQTSFADGVATTAKWYRDNGYL